MMAEQHVKQSPGPWRALRDERPQVSGKYRLIGVDGREGTGEFFAGSAGLDGSWYAPEFQGTQLEYWAPIS
jgi:hypothetical protein